MKIEFPEGQGRAFRISPVQGPGLRESQHKMAS